MNIYIHTFSLSGITDAPSQDYRKNWYPQEKTRFLSVSHYLGFHVRHRYLQLFSGSVSLRSFSLDVPPPLPSYPKRTLVEDTPAKRHFTPVPEGSLKCIIRVSGRHFQGNLIH